VEAQEQAKSEAGPAIDYYRVLRLDPDAPQELVVEAYWCLADKLKAELAVRGAAESELAALNEAYAVLSITAQRDAYDRTVPRIVELRRQRAERARARKPWRLRHHNGVSRTDSYELLRVDETAPAALIARAYSILRTLRAKEGAPREHLAELAEARSLLLNAETRKTYDVSRKQGAAPGPAIAKAVARPEVPKPTPNTRTVPSAADSFAEGLGRRSQEVSKTVKTVPASQRTTALAALAAAAARGGRTALAASGSLLRKAATTGGKAASGKARADDKRPKRRRQQEEQSKVGELPDERLLRYAASSAASPQAAEQAPELLSPARLILEHPDSGRQVIGLGERPVMLGGDASCDIRLTAEPGKVADKHAQIWFAGDRFVIHSLDQLCPTMIGGQTVNWAVLEDGDDIQIGDHRLRFEMRPASEHPPDFLTVGNDGEMSVNEIPERHT
jgi:curved DNA-binding protein CbpA